MGAVDLTAIEAVVTRRQRLKDRIAELAAEVEELDARIKAEWGDAEEATIDGQPVGTWKEVTSTRLDQAKVKRHLSDAAMLDDFLVTSTTRTFRLTWVPPEPAQQRPSYGEHAEIEGYEF